MERPYSCLIINPECTGGPIVVSPSADTKGALSLGHWVNLISCILALSYHEAYLYAPVVRLESFRTLIAIAALFDLELRQFDVSTA